MDRVEDPEKITEHDIEPGNVMIRAGYLRGLASRMGGQDRAFLLRASRSLSAYAAELMTRIGEPPSDATKGSP